MLLIDGSSAAISRCFASRLMDVVLAPAGNLAVPPGERFLCRLLGSLRALATQRLGQFTLLGRVCACATAASPHSSPRKHEEKSTDHMRLP
jgi:hypothetical protein